MECILTLNLIILFVCILWIIFFTQIYNRTCSLRREVFVKRYGAKKSYFVHKGPSQGQNATVWNRVMTEGVCTFGMYSGRLTLLYLLVVVGISIAANANEDLYGVVGFMLITISLLWIVAFFMNIGLFIRLLPALILLLVLGVIDVLY